MSSLNRVRGVGRSMPGVLQLASLGSGRIVTLQRSTEAAAIPREFNHEAVRKQRAVLAHSQARGSGIAQQGQDQALVLRIDAGYAGNVHRIVLPGKIVDLEDRRWQAVGLVESIAQNQLQAFFRFILRVGLARRPQREGRTAGGGPLLAHPRAIDRVRCNAHNVVRNGGGCACPHEDLPGKGMTIGSKVEYTARESLLVVSGEADKVSSKRRLGNL